MNQSLHDKCIHDIKPRAWCALCPKPTWALAVIPLPDACTQGTICDNQEDQIDAITALDSNVIV